MKISVITPNYNGAAYLKATLDSVLQQRAAGVDLECIVVDGGSTDASLDIVRAYGDAIDHVITEPDDGPADAINKGMRVATGEILCWLNSDDLYAPSALNRVIEAFAQHPDKALCFGRCPIVDEKGDEIRHGITRFKEMFYPVSCRFAIQCLNYVSQPACFFRREAWLAAGELNATLHAAWDYDLLLRLWRQGGAVVLDGDPLAQFRWHETSISAQGFRRQFREAWQVAAKDAGMISLQTLIHLMTWWGIVAIYSVMSFFRQRGADGAADTNAGGL